STSLSSLLEETSTFYNSLPKFENFYFEIREISSGSTTTHSDISLPDYEAFYFDDDHIKEISSGSTTTHSDISLSEYDSFIFEELVDELTHIISPPEYDCFYFRDFLDPAFYDDHVKEISSGSTTTYSNSSLYDSFIFNLSINPFPPADRIDFYEFVDELIHIISPPEYDCFLFKIEPNSEDFTMDVVEDISPTREPRVHNALPTHPTRQLNLKFQPPSESLFTY
nr:hypothetical protein [Tanacetum cinerariifolium]